MSIVAIVTRTHGTAGRRGARIGRTRSALGHLGRSERTDWTHVARLPLVVRLEADLAPASTGQYRPFAVALTQIRWRFGRLGVLHANAGLLLDDGHLATGRRLVEVGKVLGDRLARDVVHLDGQHTDAGALVAERKVDTLLGHRNALHLRVDVHVRVLVEATFAGSNARCRSNIILSFEP